MSSFDYTDNFSGFNDLFNRADFLTEMKIGKAHPSFKGLARRIQDDPRSGGKGWPRDARMLIKTVLYNVDIFTEEDIKALRASGVEASREYREALEALLDKYEDEIKDKASDIADELEKQFESFVNDQGLMVGAERKEMYLAKREAKAAADKLEKEIEGGGDIVDAVEDAVDDVEQVMSQAAKEGFQSLQMSKEDPTTFIEIKIRDADKASDVSDIVTKYANEDGVEVVGDTVQFSVDPDTPLADAVSRHGIDKIEAALKRDVDKISDSVVIVMAPDEDYEEDMYGMEGDESYAANENEVQEDNEDLSAKKARAGKDIGKPGKNFEKISDKAAKKYGSKEAGDRVAGAVLAKMRGNYEGEEHPAQRAAESIIGAEVMWDGFRKRGQVEEVDVERGIAIVYDEDGGEHMVELGDFDVVNEVEDNENELDHFLTKEQPEDYIPSTDYEDVLDALVDDDKKKHAMKKLGSENEEEAIKMQPMLESHKTNTSVYLTEQAASDKRNKKTETKNQSFKEKYKPKTSWQLEELRRYGL